VAGDVSIPLDGHMIFIYCTLWRLEQIGLDRF
jgi:hypothetical protein